MPGGNSGRACPDKLPVDLDHAGVACLNRAELGMITNVGNFGASSQKEINETFVRVRFNGQAIKRHSGHHKQSPKRFAACQSVLLLQRQLDFFVTPGRKLIAYDETGTGVPVQ